MFIHVPTEWFEEHPLAGVVLGIIFLTMCGFLFHHTWEEYRRFPSEPAALNAAELDPSQLDPGYGRWVKLQGLDIFCGEVYKRERTPPDSWILGKVETTYIVGLAGKHFVVLRYEDDTDCGGVVSESYTGVIEPMNDRLRSNLASNGLVIPPAPAPVYDFCATCGPEDSRFQLKAGALLTFFGVVFLLYFFRKYQKKSERTLN